jgi:hypothetical protein
LRYEYQGREMSKLAKAAALVPLLAGIWVVGGGSMSAAVQDLSPVEAVQLLARSEAIDSKCRHLSLEEHEELSDYVARAEVAVAAQTTAEQASQAVHTGADSGRNAVCGRESEITVRATMDAARRAIYRANDSAREEQPADEQQQKQKVRPTALRTTDEVEEPVSRLSGQANRYSQLAAAYYVERRCKHLTHAQALDFWNRIVIMHKSVLSNEGPDVLSAAKSRAIAAAKARNRCSSATAQLVRNSYQMIRR